MLKKTLSSRQFAQVLNLVRAAYLDEGGRNGSSRLYTRLVDIADAAGFKQNSDGWWHPPADDRWPISIVLENGGK